MFAYDVLIIGSGTGGQTAAFYLKEKGLNVALVEKADRPGGTCALKGCQPKKWFYEVAETVAASRHLDGKGIVEAARADWGQVLEQKQHFISGVPDRTVKNLQKTGIEFIAGTASFCDEQTLMVNGEKIHSRFYILATGAKPVELDIKGAAHVITSDEFLELNVLPPSIVFIGGGFISFEFAHFAARLGSAENQRSVILETGDRPLSPFDKDMVELLVEASSAEGIDARCGVQVSGIEKQNNGFLVRTAQKDTIKTDLVVHGAGRAPDLRDLSLNAAGVEYSECGIGVDHSMRTSNPRVFAVGDCAATVQLARVADAEARVAAENIVAELGRGGNAVMDYHTVPAVLFTCPQMAMVGQTEEDVKQEGKSYKKNFGKHLNWPTYRRVGLKHAAYKILTDAENKILGAHILSDQASGLINTIKQGMYNGTTVDELYRQTILSPYPTRESDLSYMLKPLLSG